MTDKRVFSPEAMLAAVLHRDEDCLVVNKPAGLPVHRTPKGDENLEDYFEALCFGLLNPPALAHRLDKETSGCLVLGRHKQALARLGHLFEKGRVVKRYMAVVIGAPSAPEGAINQPMRRFDLGRGKWEFRIASDGQEAITEYKTLAQSDGYALLSLHPLTGRTHQLRLHCQFMGCPILGDVFYGGARPETDRLHLHAEHVSIPYAGIPIEVSAPLPDYFRQTLDMASLYLPI
jgi:tRNA pseudouridine32 synthase/23S rRNA pseudouridine746 synthase